MQFIAGLCEPAAQARTTVDDDGIALLFNGAVPDTVLLEELEPPHGGLFQLAGFSQVMSQGTPLQQEPELGPHMPVELLELDELWIRSPHTLN